MENINDRFPSIPVLDALAVLDPRNLPPVNRLGGCGDPQIILDRLGLKSQAFSRRKKQCLSGYFADIL